MGVNIYLLDRRPVRLSVGGVEHEIGSLRRFWKITEIDAERAAELIASKTAAHAAISPSAAMVAEVCEIPLGSASGIRVAAHLVIGWDEGRNSVTDMGWDYLPVLGYGVRNPDTGGFTLFEEADGALHAICSERAVELGITGPGGLLIRRGQPTISSCRYVRPFIAGYAEADCMFSDGRLERLLIGTPEGTLPDPTWLIGKKPMQVGRYSLRDQAA